MRLRFALFAWLCVCLPAWPQTTDAMAAAASAGDWHRVATLAEARTRRLPNDAVGWTFLGLADSNLGQRDRALAAFARAVKLSPADPVPHTNYGAALEKEGRREEAAAEYRRALKIHPTGISALVNLARLDANNGSEGQQRAANYLNRAWAVAPDAEIAASLLVLEPCTAPARMSHTERLGTGEGLPAALRLQAAEGLERCSEWAAAEPLLRSVLAESTFSAAQREEALIGLARAQIQQGRLEDAAAGLQAAVAGGFETPELLRAQGEVEQRLGRYDLAVPPLLRAITLAPQDEDLRFRYGLLLLDAQTPKAAELRTTEALKRFPGSSRLWFLLGLSYFDQDEPTPARTAFDHAIALDGTFPAALAYRGLAASSELHYAEAISFYRRAIALEPRSADLSCLLAEALQLEHPDDPTSAYAELQRALAIDPASSRASLLMGRIDLDRGQPERAIAEIEKALSLDPSAEKAHFFLARAYRQIHQPEQAAKEASLFADLSTVTRTEERERVQKALRQLVQTRF